MVEPALGTTTVSTEPLIFPICGESVSHDEEMVRILYRCAHCIGHFEMLGTDELSNSCNLIANDDTPTADENDPRISLLGLDKINRLFDSPLDLYQSSSLDI